MDSSSSSNGTGTRLDYVYSYVQIGPASVVCNAAIIHARLTLIRDDAENFIGPRISPTDRPTERRTPGIVSTTLWRSSIRGLVSKVGTRTVSERGGT